VVVLVSDGEKFVAGLVTFFVAVGMLIAAITTSLAGSTPAIASVAMTVVSAAIFHVAVCWRDD
jgi:uncharacterized membrane protein YhhN